jgi:osmoprotectant transport system permease protein
MNAVIEYLGNNAEQVADWTAVTAVLATAPLLVGIACAVPLGWVAFRFRLSAALLLPAAKVLYTIPSLVLFLFLPSVLGTRILDPLNVAVALTLYTAALLTPAVTDGFRSVPEQLADAAAAMGQTGWQRFWSLQLPLAIPVIGASVRVAAVSNVALISVASVIGIAQLGQLFVVGNNIGNLAPIVLGLVMFVALALILDGLIVVTVRGATPWARGAVV